MDKGMRDTTNNNGDKLSSLENSSSYINNTQGLSSCHDSVLHWAIFFSNKAITLVAAPNIRKHLMIHEWAFFVASLPTPSQA